MTNYIIDPTVFYWMNVLGILQTVLAVIGGVLMCSAIGTVIAYIVYIYDIDDYNQEMQASLRRRANACKKATIALLSIGVPMVLASVFIPSKQTSVEMLVARTATFDNVDWTVQQVKEVVDYIVNALKGVA